MLFRITILLILCILLFYIFFYKKNKKNIIYSNENFVNNETIPIDQGIINKYNRFVDFYNSFLKNWEESMITMASLEIPQKEATSPSQSPSTSKPSTPTNEQLNQTIQSYSQKIGKSLPSITDPLPNNIYSYSLQQLLQIIPSDPIPFQNALTLLNEHLINSQKDLDKVLSGQFAEGFLVIEGYVADQCAELSTCFAQNPQIAEQIANAQIEQEKKQQQQLQNQLSTRLDKFILNNTLQDSFKMNQTLIQKAKEIQNKAQSGELLNMINIPDTNPIPPYNIPAGGNRLKQMKESDPEKYKEYEKNNSSLFSLKNLFEQINSNLR